jgi:AcrR family transcriptional regulator
MPLSDSAADRLLIKAFEYIDGEGDANDSLRTIAEGIGTSHRMLQYHFVTKERLLAGVYFKFQARAMEKYDASDLQPTTRSEYVRASWDFYRDPANYVMIKLLLLINNPAAGALEDTTLMTMISAPWSATLTELGITEGLTPERSESESRLVRNAWRGLHSDLYGTGETAPADAAVEVLIEWVSVRS